jgi:hypothetical protein
MMITMITHELNFMISEVQIRVKFVKSPNSPTLNTSRLIASSLVLCDLMDNIALYQKDTHMLMNCLSTSDS